jgi:hypothetical protein
LPIDCGVVTCGDTGIAVAVVPSELDLLSEFAAEPELAVDIPRQNIKQFTLFSDLAADAESARDADADDDSDIVLPCLSVTAVLPCLSVQVVIPVFLFISNVIASPVLFALSNMSSALATPTPIVLNAVTANRTANIIDILVVIIAFPFPFSMFHKLYFYRYILSIFATKGCCFI